MTNSNIKSYAQIQNALLTGSAQYLQNKNYSAGFYHGVKGRVKAIKVDKYAKAIGPDNKQALLCLTLAVLDSSSNALAFDIASLLITGRYSCTTSTTGLSTENTLQSNVFSRTALVSSYQNKKNGEVTLGCENGHNWQYNSLKGARALLKQEFEFIDQENAPINLVKQFKAQLRNSSSEDIDCSIIPSIELNPQ